MRISRPSSLKIVLLTLALALLTPAGRAEALDIQIDATDIERALIHSTITLDAKPGEMDLYYVEWTPGNHNPSGPIQNVVNFFVRNAATGAPLRWTRDPTHVVRHIVEVPEGVGQLRVELTYIANQPSVISRSTDSYGRPSYGAINWNTVVVYPGGSDKDELQTRASVAMPEGWTHSSSLRVASVSDDNVVAFQPVGFAELIDSPVTLGARMTSVQLSVSSRAPHVVDLTAPRDELVTLPEETLDVFAKVVDQAIEVFGPFPHDRFHFQLLADDALPGFGLEHGESTFISLTEDEVTKAGADDRIPLTVIAHEYIHAWNGKLRTPEGLLHRNYHTPALTQLMWVYEGMTTYYTAVLAVRAGMLTFEEFADGLGQRIARYERQEGRRWRSVEDTAAGLRFLRAGSPKWGDLRRRQDYYSEGALFWMEADALIRRSTNGARSLDDLCRSFFDVPAGPAGSPVTYTRGDVVRALEDVAPSVDWDALIRERIERPVEDLRIDLPGALGWRLTRVNEPSKFDRERESDDDGVTLSDSLGLSANKGGEITAMIYGAPAERAGLGYGMTIVAVNGLVYSPKRLLEATRETPEAGVVELLVNVDGERIKTFRIQDAQGMRYPRLERDESRGPDILRAIAEPR